MNFVIISMNFLHYFSPQPILFQYGFFTVRWYGFLIALAFVLGVCLLVFLAKKRGLKADDIYDLSFGLALGGVLGARLAEVFFYGWDYYQKNPGEIFKIWHGGMSIHGAILGGVCFLFFWAKKKKISFWLLADLLAPALALGQSLGRWGNYFNQELFGWPTNLPWGIPIELANRPPEFLNFQYFQPVFLYESIFNLILFLILWLLILKKNLKSGQVFVFYLLGYGLIRFVMEFIRVDFQPVFVGLRMGQWLSLAVIFISLAIFFKTRKNNS